MPRKRRPSELLAPGTYERLVEIAGERCWICSRPRKPGARRLHIDHDHGEKGQLVVRGLLDFRCNKLLLGHWVTPEILRRAADYLEAVPPL